MANISSYNQLSSWNEDDDLLFVQQPDAPKKAHPSQMKEYVEAGDFEATGEIIDGHGNILAKKADMTTVTIPEFIPSQAGWRRICKIKPISGMSTVDAMVYIGGAWTNGQPPSASLAVSIMGSSTSLTLLSSAIGDSNKMTDIRLVSASSGAYWVDVYFPAYSSNTGIFKLTFTGDIAVSDIQNPISITTDATAASAEISLNQNVSGTVLTDKNSILSAKSSSVLDVDGTFQIPSAMLDRKVIIISINRAAWTGSAVVTTTQIKQGDCASGIKIVSGDIRNPTVDKYIIMGISPTGLITIKYINNWSAPFVSVNAL